MAFWSGDLAEIDVDGFGFPYPKGKEVMDKWAASLYICEFVVVYATAMYCFGIRASCRFSEDGSRQLGLGSEFMTATVNTLTGCVR